MAADLWVVIERSTDEHDAGRHAYHWRDARTAGGLLLDPAAGFIERMEPSPIGPDGFVTAALALREEHRRTGAWPERVAWEAPPLGALEFRPPPATSPVVDRRHRGDRPGLGTLAERAARARRSQQ